MLHYLFIPYEFITDRFKAVVLFWFVHRLLLVLMSVLVLCTLCIVH